MAVISMLGACKMMDKGDGSGDSKLSDYRVFEKDSTDGPISKRYELFFMPRQAYFMLCFRWHQPKYNTAKGSSCGNPFVILNKDRAKVEYLGLNAKQKEFLKLASEYLADDSSKNDDDLYRVLRERDLLPESFSFFDVREIRHMHENLKKYGMTLNQVISHEHSQENKTIVHDDYDNATYRLVNVLDHLSRLLAKIIEIDYRNVDYCYPFFGRNPDFSYSSKEWSRCAIGGLQGLIGVDYKPSAG
ncbi:MAG: hypothetical protein OXC44_03110 [Proteobacteria bacterium]|nr:hypothetical protein [Pseudomonadota bacterium]